MPKVSHNLLIILVPQTATKPLINSHLIRQYNAVIQTVMKNDNQ
jgi:hypothetical protein